MRKTDINKYTGTPLPVGYRNNAAGEAVVSKVKTTLTVVWKVCLTFLLVTVLTGVIVGVSMLFYVFSLSGETIDVDLRTLRLNQTSFIYEMDEEGNFKEAQAIETTENREWVPFDEIPQQMKDAMIAIEDKRFEEHHGVDWVRTSGAIYSLFTGKDSYGGSTITQQLVKNITDDDDVSLTRKLKEIFRALNLEKEYSKDEILEMYLNYVNFGGNCEGVQAAAKRYFDKEIKDCSIAQCAAIAGITQNPYKYDPLRFPDENKTRRETVLQEMLNQGKITKEEYNQSMEESANMTFAKQDSTNVVQNTRIVDWYTETLLTDLTQDVAEEKNISLAEADHYIRTAGLKVYSAKDARAQSIAESITTNEDYFPANKPKVEVGYTMMDYDGRVLAVIGGRGEKQANKGLNYSMIPRQPGSSIKPISVYAPAIEYKKIHYSSIIPDKPIDWDKDGDGVIDHDWPPNHYGSYNPAGETVEYGLERSSNAMAAQVLMKISLTSSFDFLTQKMHITTLDSESDMLPSSLATGGTYKGLTVREMTAAFQTFGNGGVYNKPYTYFYVENDLGERILDNESRGGEQAISSTTSTIMRELLKNVVYGAQGTGGRDRIPGTTVFGKTGTTNDNEQSWFIGGTPYAVAGVWIGDKDVAKMTNAEAAYASKIWQAIMSEYISELPKKDFVNDPNVVARSYCVVTGNLAGDACSQTKTGYYAKDFIPPVCDGVHSGAQPSLSESGGTSSVAPSSSQTESSGPPSDVSSDVSSHGTSPENTSVPVTSSGGENGEASSGILQ